MIKQRLIDFFLQESWNVGFVTMPLEHVIGSTEPLNIQWLKHDYKDRWFADPFILDVDENNIYVLVEDYVRTKAKAHISLLTVDRLNYKLLDIDPIIEESTHLSFPIINRKEDHLLIYPENGASGKLKLYSFDRITKKCKFERELFDGALADAVLVNIQGQEYLVATEGEELNGKILNFYVKDSSVFRFERSVHFERNTARNAGEWFNFDGQLYRPAQDCDLRYGAAMEIQRFNPQDFSFDTVRRIAPTSKKYSRGIHTFNHFKGYSVVDGYGYDRPIIAKIFEYLYSHICRLK